MLAQMESHARGPGLTDRQAAGFTAICSPSSAALVSCSSSLLQWLHKCSLAPGTTSASGNQATDSTHSPGVTQMITVVMQVERLRKGRFISSAGFGWFFKLEGGAVKIKPTQNGHKEHVVSPLGWAALEHISENLKSFPHTRLVFRSFNKESPTMVRTMSVTLFYHWLSPTTLLSDSDRAPRGSL